MLSCSKISFNQANTYFDHAEEYYTKNLSCYDRWHGLCAKSNGLKGDLSPEEFKCVVGHIQKYSQREYPGIDCTFSAPKSVSLAMAYNETTKADMIRAHQQAVEKIVSKIEIEYMQTRHKKKIVKTMNMQAAEFVHLMARPTKANNYVPDLDLHSHLVIMNTTMYQGQNLAADFRKLLDNGSIKSLGLEYRQELAKELQDMGYQLELTDARNGFFELSGFSRDIIESYSHRRQEVLKTANEKNISDMQEATRISKVAKERGEAGFVDVCEAVKKDLFTANNFILQKEEHREYERNYRTNRGHEKEPENQPEVSNSESSRRLPSVADIRGTRGEKDFINGAGGISLQNMQPRGMDVGQEPQEPSMLLSESGLHSLAKLQQQKIRDYYLRISDAQYKGQRAKRIEQLAQEVVQQLSLEKYAFTLPEVKHRLMAAGLLECINEQEAKRAIESTGVINLGRIERAGKASDDVYLTTEQNIQIEADIVERMKAGKGKIIANVPTLEASIQLLKRIESQAIANGITDFAVSMPKAGYSDEQAQAIHHILTSHDRYIGIQGLAGTGKTTMMQRLKWVADEMGIEVKGACFTGKAADGLQAESEITSNTIHGFLNQLSGSKGGVGNWDFTHIEHLPEGKREIWAVDEAGLVDMHLMNQLQQAAEARGAQVVLLGDVDQLPPVGSGEPLRQMEEAGMQTAYLTDIKRQKDSKLLKAVQESVNGDHLNTFEILEAKGNYHEIAVRKERMETITKEVSSIPLLKYVDNNKLCQLLLVSTNADRKAYNQAIREAYLRKGELQQGNKFTISVQKNGELLSEQRYFAPGDRVIFSRNDSSLKVKNGTLGTIVSIQGARITVRTDSKHDITFDTTQYNSIDYAYAVTSYKAQGMTVNKVVVDMSTKGTPQNRNALYVDISRAKYDAVVYTDDKQKLEQATKRFVKKVTGKDFAKKLSKMRQMQSDDIIAKYRYKAVDTSRQEAAVVSMDRFMHNFFAPNHELLRELHLAAERQKSARVAKEAKSHSVEKHLQPTIQKEKSQDSGLSR